MNTEVITALEYQQCLMALPNPERGRFPANRVKVAVAKQDGIRKIEYDLKCPSERPSTQLVEMREVEFEICFEKPIPFWQPAYALTIIPIKSHEK